MVVAVGVEDQLAEELVAVALEDEIEVVDADDALVPVRCSITAQGRVMGPIVFSVSIRAIAKRENQNAAGNVRALAGIADKSMR